MGTACAEPQFLVRSLAQFPQNMADNEILHLVSLNVSSIADAAFARMFRLNTFFIGRAARERGFVIRVKSNGHAIRGTLAERLKKEVNPYQVEMSLHGASPKRHDRQPGEPGSFKSLGKNDGSPVVAADKVVIASADGRIYMLDAETGEKVWSYEIGSPISGTPAIVKDRIYIGAHDGVVYSFGVKK